jgi:formate-dependent phosphoribosylglycinamide formyltransferase (GAR transformylase)
MHVVFVEPCFPQNQREVLRGLLRTGARVTALSERSPESLPSDLRGRLHGFERLRSVVDEPALHDAVRRAHGRTPVDRLECTIEAHVLPVAHVRERLGIHGTTARTAFLCRDKTAMKETLRKADVPTAASTRATSADEVRSFAERTGYPLILKPLDAAGAAGTIRVGSRDELERALPGYHLEAGRALAVEEFVEGHEGFYDTVTIEGRTALDFATHYFPNVLEAMRTRWISPQIVTTNRIEETGYQEARALGQRVAEVLGIWTSATHMEWFFGPKGLRFSEIGCRPPGVGVWDLYCAANEFDLYRAWAEAIVHGWITQRPSRAFSAGMVALRPEADGTIRGYSGVEELRSRYGRWLIDMHLPPAGSATQPVENGYMANAWVRMKHPDFDALRAMLDWVGAHVQVRAG